MLAHALPPEPASGLLECPGPGMGPPYWTLVEALPSFKTDQALAQKDTSREDWTPMDVSAGSQFSLTGA